MVSMLVALSGLTVGAWKVSFTEPDARLTLVNEEQKVAVEGKLSFVSDNAAWTVADARDAAAGRLALVNRGGTVFGYLSFRANGNHLTLQALHRAGAIFYTGVLTFDGTATVRPDSFACRTRPKVGERVLSFADGAGDSPANDSVFAREEDLAVRFDAPETRVATLGGGKYGVKLSCRIEEASEASISVEADPHYYASRWAPGYHPIDRKRCPKAPTGWMSWNTYCDKAGSQENLDEARIGQKFLQPFGMEIWSIESWQGNSRWLPVSNFHNLDLSADEPLFPEGMKKLAQEIRDLGFRPGIWMPLYGTGNETFYNEHKNWFLHRKDGTPIPCWNGKYMLDLTVPEALEHIRNITRIASRDWGYEFFKFDGMANTPRLFEKPEIRACFRNPGDPRWFDNSVKALREGIGDDRILLGCMGDFTGTEAHYLDASRLGSDVVGLYHGVAPRVVKGLPGTIVQYPVRWENVKHQAQCTFSQIFVNNIMFYTDPDTLLVSPVLEKHEADVMATIIGLPGQLMFAGDKLAELPMERMKVIQQVLPVADIHPVNLYPYYTEMPIWNLTVTRPYGVWNVVALFNFGDSEREIGFDLHEIGLSDDTPYTAFEFWTQNWLGVQKNRVSMTVPARTVRLLSVWPVENRPQFVGDDRHLTQGAVELNAMAWDTTAKTLSATVKAIGTFPITLSFRIPQGYALKSCKAAEGVQVATAKTDGELLTVTLTSPTTKDVPVVLTF